MFNSALTNVDLTNANLASGLNQLAALLLEEKPGDARARAMAVLKAAEIIRAGLRPVTQLVAERGVEAVHELGIGYELAGVITDWVRSGRLLWLERLQKQRREQVARLPGIGSQLAHKLHDTLGVDDLEGLERAAREGMLERVCGFGPKRVRMVTEILATARPKARLSDAGRRDMSQDRRALDRRSAVSRRSAVRTRVAQLELLAHS